MPLPMDHGVVFALSSVTGDDHDTGSPRLPEGGVINCNGNGILNQNQVLKVLMPMLMLLMVLMLLILNQK